MPIDLLHIGMRSLGISSCVKSAVCPKFLLTFTKNQMYIDFSMCLIIRHDYNEVILTRIQDYFCLDMLFVCYNKRTEPRARKGHPCNWKVVISWQMITIMSNNKWIFQVHTYWVYRLWKFVVQGLKEQVWHVLSEKQWNWRNQTVKTRFPLSVILWFLFDVLL